MTPSGGPINKRSLAARRIGAAGIILFSYDALIAPPNTTGTLGEIGKAAFGASH